MEKQSFHPLTGCSTQVLGRLLVHHQWQILDVKKLLEEHPRGEEVLLESAGKDATKDFSDIGHSQAAKNVLVKHQVGFLQRYSVQESNDDSMVGVDLSKESKTKEMKAFVIKEDPVPKYKDFIEFFVPLLVAGFFFGYRNLTGAAQFNS